MDQSDQLNDQYEQIVKDQCVIIFTSQKSLCSVAKCLMDSDKDFDSAYLTSPKVNLEKIKPPHGAS